MKRYLLLSIGLMLLCVAQARAQQTIVAASRSTNWSNAGIAGGIPTRTTICATLNPGATSAQINAAIAACPGGQVVKLNAGTYNLTKGIDFNGKSNVTLRGAGPDQTFIVFGPSSSLSCWGPFTDLCIRNSDINCTDCGGSKNANWTSGYAIGTTQITLSATTGLAVGSILILDQLNDAADTGQVFVCSQQGVCADEGPGGAGRSNREQEQVVRVTAISGNTVTFTPGLRMPNWRASQSPGAWWATTTAKQVGVEDLSLDHTASDAQAGSIIFLADECWFKNVKSVNANRNHVWLYQSIHAVIRDSYFYGGQAGGSQSYGIEAWMTSDSLIENNILQHVTIPLQANGAASGTVFSYNYTIDDNYTVSPTWMQASSYLHGAGADMILNEGNEGASFDGDYVHGSHHFVTAFRNYWNGWETGKVAQTVPVILYAYNRYMNIIGNVLGRSGFHDNYQDAVPTDTKHDTSIFRLGFGGGAPNDPLTLSTLMRWGNYDTVTGTSRFQASEVPSSLSAFSNPVPPNNTLPTSFYLSGRPAWFGAVTFPPIGPDVTGGPGPGGHAYKIPAHLCYDSTPKSGTILNFNANNCYASSGPAPTAPTNLRIIGGN
jgi:hypothetical protein